MMQNSVSLLQMRNVYPIMKPLRLNLIRGNQNLFHPRDGKGSTPRFILNAYRIYSNNRLKCCAYLREAFRKVGGEKIVLTTYGIITKPTETTATTTETYVGLATNFKERYRNHQSSFRRSNRRNETELSKYIWTFQDSNKPFQIKWKVLKKCKPNSNISKKCNLCLYEKFIIICKKELFSLNRRNELASSCPHRNRYVLQNSRVT